MILVNIMFDGNLMILQFTKVFLKHFLFDIMDLQLNPVGKKTSNWSQITFSTKLSQIKVWVHTCILVQLRPSKYYFSLKYDTFYIHTY